MPVTLGVDTGVLSRAYCDAERRLKGHYVPITIPSDRKGFLDKLFGRRAA
jgi:septum site-determining protein MinD